MHIVICLFSPCKIASSLSGIGYRRSFYNRPDFPLPEIYCRQFYANFAAKAQHGYPLCHKTSQPRNLQAVAMKIYSKTNQLATVVARCASFHFASSPSRVSTSPGRDGHRFTIRFYCDSKLPFRKYSTFETCFFANHDESITFRYWII